jgi:collagen type III alpha
MEDESSAQPAWMDAPASGSNAGMFGSSASKADLGAAEGGDGVDGIQAWKAQMKEMERREREGPGSVSAEKARVEPVESVSVFSALAAAPKQDPTDFVIPGAKESRASVFDNLGLGTGIAASSSGGGEGGGRGSRFAKFFDGKPVAAPAPPAQRSAFEGLLGGMMGGGGVQGGPEPSVQDRESMARLMGMLQVSGVSLFLIATPQ